MRTPLALLAVCMLSLGIGTGVLAAQEAKAEESTRLEKLLSGEPPETVQDLKAMQERMKRGSRMPGWTKRTDFDWYETLD
mgnify:CR=1 FL=1